MFTIIIKEFKHESLTLITYVNDREVDKLYRTKNTKSNKIF